MPAERVAMRQVREILRLTFSSGIAGREIARRLGIAASTVRAALERFRSTGLAWPLPDDMTDEALEDKLYANAGTKQGHRRHVEPDWGRIHRELKRKHVTLSILWEEYAEQDPSGYRYSRYVAPEFMLRDGRQARDARSFPWPARHITRTVASALKSLQESHQRGERAASLRPVVQTGDVDAR